MATKATEAQVMISLRVGTQAANSRIIEGVLEKAGYATWICIEMGGGVDFRSEIVDAVDHIDVMVLMIDTEWATSGECEAEFNLAYRKNLTSKSSPRKPTFLPVVFPNLDWNAHKHVRLLMASTNAIVVSQQKDMHEVAELLLASIRNLGITPRTEVQQSDEPSKPKEKVKRNLQKALRYWDSEDVLYFLEDNGYSHLISKFKENKVTGLDLLEASDEELKEGLGVSSFFIRKFFGDLKGLFSFDLLQGEWSCKGTLVFNHDQSTYETNSFAVNLDNYGLAASGVTLSRKDSQKNVDIKVLATSVWQGKYDNRNNFHIICKMSCDLVIEFLGQLELKTSRYGELTASLVEKDASSTKKYGTATFHLRKLVGRDKISNVELPPLPTTLASSLQRGSVRPAHFKSEKFSQLKDHLFCWRWCEKKDGQEVRALTVEPASVAESGATIDPLITPQDLYASDDFYEGIEAYKFSTSVLRGYVIVTLDADEETKAEKKSKISPNRGEIYPFTLAGTNGYSTGVTSFKFNWRWLIADDESQVRVVTLEDIE